MPSPDKKQLSTWVTPELADQIDAAAKQEGRSVSSWLRRAAEAQVGATRFTITSAPEGVTTDAA